MRLHLDPEVTTEGSGNATGKAAEVTTDLTANVQALLAKHGDASEAMSVLLKDNHRYRELNRNLKGKVPAEGSAVLSPDDAKAFAAYKALGQAPEALTAALTERDAFKAEAEAFKRDKVHAEAATLLGFKAPVLSKLAQQDKLDLVVIDGQDKAGRPVKIASVKGDGDKTTPLKEYAEAHWKDFLPSLKAEAPAAPGGSPLHRSPTAPRPQIAPEGRPVPRRNSF
jgi:hypothetical protein